MLGYIFVNLSQPQLERRRIQLDEAGLHAWLSPIILLVVLYSYNLVVRKPRLQYDPKPGQPSKPPFKLTKILRQITWILNTTYLPEFGPFQVQLVGTAYSIWLVYLAVRGTGNDYMHVTKAFGHVAVSQLPMQYLLSLKSPLSPITIATGLTHERLNAYHRLFGRIVHALLAVHATLYVNFFLAKGLLNKRARDRDVQLGLAAFWLFNVLGLLALPVVRRKQYFRLFYRSHVVVTAILPVVLFFHVPYTRVYVVQAGIFWVAGGVLRKNTSKSAIMTCESVPNTDLQKVILTVDGRSHFNDWVPGQHIYVNQGSVGPRNPFTTAKVEKLEAGNQLEIELMVRHLHGPATDRFELLAKRRIETPIEIEGPYGEANMYLPDLVAQGHKAGQIVVVAGGVGATYALPVYSALLESRDNSEGLKLIWFVRSFQDAEWGLDMLDRHSQKVDVEVHVTQPGTTDMSDGTKTKEQRLRTGIVIHRHGERPDMSQVVNSCFGPVDKAVRESVVLSEEYLAKLTILICGPSSLSQSLRREVGKHVLEYGRDVDWYEEQFGFGGS